MPPQEDTAAAAAAIVDDDVAASSKTSTPATTTTRRTKSRREQYPPGIFTNENGNLRFVSLVVRHPCKLFFAILLATLAITVLLFQSLANSENPFSDPGGQYDIKDVRSLAYDSLRLAVEHVKDVREESNKDSRRLVLKRQAEETALLVVQPQMEKKNKYTLRSLLPDYVVAAVEEKLAKAKSTVSRSRSSSTSGSHKTKKSRRHRRQLQTNVASNNNNKNRIQEQGLDFTYWVYEAESTNEKGVFGSADAIRGMRESQQLFLQHSAYADYCWKSYETVEENNATTTTISECRAPLSPLNMYYPSRYDPNVADLVITALSDPVNVQRYNALGLCVEFNLLCDQVDSNEYSQEDFEWARNLNANMTVLTSAWDGTGELVNEEYIDQVTNLVAHLLQLRTKRGFVDFGFDKGFSLENQKSMFSRTVFTWGGPLAQTSANGLSEEDREDEDEEFLKDYFVDNFLDKMNEISETGHDPNVNSYYFMGVLILEVLLDIVIRDALMAIASFVFVFLYLRLTVGSWFLAIVGMAEIILSVPVSWFIYKVVLRIDYFAFLNVLTLFIVAAIGADDIFIFMDAYKQSAHSNDPEILESLESRMSWVYRRTGTAMFITSATTCAAFLCALITPLVDIRSFGLFAAIVIFFDYVLVMTLYCTAVVIYHNKFERPGCCSSCGALCRTADPSSTTKAFQSISADNDDQGDRVSRFFRNTVSPFIDAPLSRIFIAILFLAWMVVAVIYTIQIEPTKEAEQFLREDHPLQKSLTIINNEFPIVEDDLGLEVYFAWGIGQVDRDGVNQLIDPEFLGEPTFVDNFQFNEQCQTELLNACVTLRSNSDYQQHIKQENGLNTVTCFIEELAAYSALGSLEDCSSVLAGAWRSQAWQVPAEDVSTIMQGFLQERSCLSDEGLSVLNQYENEIGWDGSNLRFAAMALESSVVDPFSTLAEETVRTEYDKMIEISVALDKAVGAACGGKVTMTDLDIKFVFMNNQSIYTSSALQSSLLGIGLSFAVLLLSTRIFHIAFLATVSIACVLISVTGTMVLIGWTLGSTESVLISIISGFAVDYVVHLSLSYAQAYGKVDQRIKTAFGEMGISVLHGMVTSVGACVPLFLCQLTFFRKFGTFMFMTIMFSWLFANFVFMSALAQLKFKVKSKEEVRSTPSDNVDAARVAKPAFAAATRETQYGGDDEVVA